MRRHSTVLAALASAVACTFVPQVQAETRNIVIGPEAAALLDEIGLPRGYCPYKRRFDLVGEFDIRPGYSGSVGEFQTSSASFLRIDSAASQVQNSWRSMAWQYAGALGTWTHQNFRWYPMAEVPDGAFWV